MTTDNLSRKEAARYLTAHYFPVSHKTLANLAYMKQGPCFIRPGWRTVIYTRAALDEWARTRLVTVQTEIRRPSRPIVPLQSR